MPSAGNGSFQVKWRLVKQINGDGYIPHNCVVLLSLASTSRSSCFWITRLEHLAIHARTVHACIKMQIEPRILIYRVALLKCVHWHWVPLHPCLIFCQTFYFSSIILSSCSYSSKISLFCFSLFLYQSSLKFLTILSHPILHLLDFSRIFSQRFDWWKRWEKNPPDVTMRNVLNMAKFLFRHLEWR